MDFENSFYNRELNSLKKRGLFRERRVFDKSLIDLASNDYLGISNMTEPFEETVSQLREIRDFSPKASMLVNGYHQIHQDFEKYLSKINGFESAIAVGSGFLANFGLIESLVRNEDELFMDSEYHASGVVATRVLRKDQTKFFKHNSAENLEKLLENSKAKRKIVAVEGIYSMSGDLLNREIFSISEKYGAILIVDEAHSFGVVGENLLGVFDLFNIIPKNNHIKMGTLGKAVGSYGAYILSSKEIISFLENRAKPVIYSTAPSLFDTLFAHFSIEHILNNAISFKRDILERREIFKRELLIDREGLIFPIEIRNSEEALQKRDFLEREGFIVGAIRPPTVEKAILRVIGRRNVSLLDLKRFMKIIKSF
jgi:8-amino-7-oxononanoate synthase